MPSTATKVCPVVLRERGGVTEILVFRHPWAGVQLVKGTVEDGEAIDAAALRELAEESGLTSVQVTRSLGSSEKIAPGQIWHFVLCYCADPADAWSFHTLDDGGHDFAFSWWPLNAAPGADWHPIFGAALTHVRTALAK